MVEKPGRGVLNWLVKNLGYLCKHMLNASDAKKTCKNMKMMIKAQVLETLK